MCDYDRIEEKKAKEYLNRILKLKTKKAQLKVISEIWKNGYKEGYTTGLWDN